MSETALPKFTHFTFVSTKLANKKTMKLGEFVSSRNCYVFATKIISSNASKTNTLGQRISNSKRFFLRRKTNEFRSFVHEWTMDYRSFFLVILRTREIIRYRHIYCNFWSQALIFEQCSSFHGYFYPGQLEEQKRKWKKRIMC